MLKMFRQDFLPIWESLKKFPFPKGKNIRIDTGITDYSVITPYFDSMMAKLIVHAETREKAISLAAIALKKVWIRGIKTTIPFCLAVLNHKKFKKGDFNTSFIEKEMDKLYYHEEEDEMLAAYVAAFDFAAELETNRTTKPDFERGKNISPWVLNKRLEIIIIARIMKLLKSKKKADPEYIAVTPADKKYVIRNPFSEELRINGHKQDIKIFEDEEGFTFIEYKNKKYLAEITDKNQNKYTVLLNGLSYTFTIESPISYRRRKYLEKFKQINKLEVITAPMPGKIVELLVEENARVKEGEAILILEAMKMQNEIIAMVAGKIRKYKC